MGTVGGLEERCHATVQGMHSEHEHRKKKGRRNVKKRNYKVKLKHRGDELEVVDVN